MARQTNTINRHKGIGSFFKKNIVGWIMLLPTILFAYFIVWRPTIMGFYSSLFKMRGSVKVDFVGLKNYIDIVTDTNFLTVLFNTIKYT